MNKMEGCKTKCSDEALKDKQQKPSLEKDKPTLTGYLQSMDSEQTSTEYNPGSFKTGHGLSNGLGVDSPNCGYNNKHSSQSDLDSKEFIEEDNNEQESLYDDQPQSTKNSNNKDTKCQPKVSEKSEKYQPPETKESSDASTVRALTPMVKTPAKCEIVGRLAHINNTQLYGDLFTRLKSLKETYKLDISQLFDVVDRRFAVLMAKGTADRDLCAVALIKGYEVIVRLGGTGKLWHQKLKKLHKTLASYHLPQHNLVASILCFDLYTTYLSRHKLGKACECLKIVKFAQQNLSSGLWRSELFAREAMLALKQAQINPNLRRQLYQEALHHNRLARAYWLENNTSMFDGSTNYSIAYHTSHMVELQLDLPAPGILPLFLRTNNLRQDAMGAYFSEKDVRDAGEMMASAKDFASQCTGQYAYIHFYTGIAEIFLLMRRTQLLLLQKEFSEAEKMGQDAIKVFENWMKDYFSDINAITVVMKEQLHPVLEDLIAKAKMRQDLFVTTDLSSDE